MTFILVKEPVIKHEVALSIPGGESALAEFHFRYKAPAEFAEWFDLYRPRFGLDWLKHALKMGWRKLRRQPALTARDVVRKGINGWAGVTDAQGNEILFSVEQLDLLLEAYPQSTHELLQGYFKAIVEGQRKN